MTRRWLALAVLAVFGGCDDGPSRPNPSYIFPTAIIGVPVASPEEGERIKDALATFAQRHDLVRYRPIEVPFFAEKNRLDPLMHLERQTMYNPRHPNDREGFSIQPIEYSAQCYVVSVSERSGIWSEESLKAVQSIDHELVELTKGRAKVFVQPRPEQNWPKQQSSPERPNYLAELCVRMGLRTLDLPRKRQPKGPYRAPDGDRRVKFLSDVDVISKYIC